MPQYSLNTTITIVTSISLLLASTCEGAKIVTLDVPVAVRNDTGPVELVCIYQINTDENGLVIKWYHDSEQIYQWIPPMSPEDIGIINGYTKYPLSNINRPSSHSIIHLTKVNLDMTGDYTCSVSTFLEDDAQTKRMTIYVPDEELVIHANPYTKGHVNLTCISAGARPKPNLTIFVNNQQLESGSIRVENYRGYPWIRQETIIPDFINPVLIQCEISIPGTGYRRREKLVYYPKNHHH